VVSIKRLIDTYSRIPISPVVVFPDDVIHSGGQALTPFLRVVRGWSRNFKLAV